MLEGGIHLDPVTGYVQGYQELEKEEVSWVEIAQHHYQAGSSTS